MFTTVLKAYKSQNTLLMQVLASVTEKGVIPIIAVTPILTEEPDGETSTEVFYSQGSVILTFLRELQEDGTMATSVVIVKADVESSEFVETVDLPVDGNGIPVVDTSSLEVNYFSSKMVNAFFDYRSVWPTKVPASLWEAWKSRREAKRNASLNQRQKALALQAIKDGRAEDARRKVRVENARVKSSRINSMAKAFNSEQES